MGFTERRKNKRVADALALSVQTEATSRPGSSAARTHVVKLSTDGMRFSSATKLPTDAPVRMELHLNSQTLPVNLMAQVVHCAENKTIGQNDSYQTRVIFKEVNDRTRTLIEQHIKQVIKRTQVIKELPYRQSA